jgi:hypothetical protein
MRSQTQDKAQKLVKKLEQGLLNLLESGEWKSYLLTQSRFHKYSFYNTCLILHQYPDATRVAGYNELSKPPLYFTLWSPMSFDDLKTIIAMFNMTETELIDAWYSLDIIPSIIAVCLYISIYIIGGSAIGYFALMFVDKIDSQIIQHFQK